MEWNKSMLCCILNMVVDEVRGMIYDYDTRGCAVKGENKKK